MATRPPRPELRGLFLVFGALRHEANAATALWLFCRTVVEGTLDINVMRDA